MFKLNDNNNNNNSAIVFIQGGGDTSLLAICSVDQQRNNLSLTSLSNGRRWGRHRISSQVTGLLPMQVNEAFHGIEKTHVIKAYNIYVYGIDFSSD